MLYCPQHGAKQRTLKISLEDQPFPVLDSLYPILDAICDAHSFDVNSWYWIDSICINQEDKNEVSSQVPLMGQLYGAATSTAEGCGSYSLIRVTMR